MFVYLFFWFNFVYLGKCDTISINGLSYDPFTNRWSWTDSTDLSYALHAVKST